MTLNATRRKYRDNMRRKTAFAFENSNPPDDLMLASVSFAMAYWEVVYGILEYDSWQDVFQRVPTIDGAANG